MVRGAGLQLLQKVVQKGVILPGQRMRAEG